MGHIIFDANGTPSLNEALHEFPNAKNYSVHKSRPDLYTTKSAMKTLTNYCILKSFSGIEFNNKSKKE